MTIRKISGATSSIITKAQLIVGTPGIFKASVTRNQLLATVQTEVDIVKSALISPRIIDRLLYDDEGSSRFLREFILIGSQDRISVGLTKAFSDLVVMLDVTDLARLALGASARDTINADEQTFFAVDKSLVDNFNPVEAISKGIQNAVIDALLPQTDKTTILPGKGINDSLIAQDQNLVFGYGFTYRDNFETIDLKSLEPNKASFDAFTVTDARVTFLTDKYLADSFGTVDLAGVFDGITYNALLQREDTATIYEYAAFAVTSYRSFLDDLLIADPVSLEMQIARTEQLLTADFSNLQIVLNRFEELNSADQLTFDIANSYFDPVDPADTTAFNFDLLLVNRDPALVSITDRPQLQAGLERAESILAQDTQRYFDIAKTFADAFTPISLAAVSDGNIFLFNHYTNDTVTITDLLLSLVVGASRQFDDAAGVEEIKTLLIDKGLFDASEIQEVRNFSVLKVAADFQDVVETKYLQLDLSRVDSQPIFDVGTQLYTFKDIFNTTNIDEVKTFVINKDVADSAEAIEYFARRFDAVRGERDGFVETFLTNDRSSLEPGKFNYEELVYQDIFTRVLLGERVLEETIPAQDTIYKLEQRNPAHAIVAADLGYVFNIVKGFNDPVNMLDLAGTFDGSKYSISMDKTEDQPVYEYYRPKWRIRRRGRDGFLEEVVITDLFSIDRKQDIDPLANYVYTFGDDGFRYTPSGGQHYYNGINGELFLFFVAPEWTTFDITLGRFEDQPTPDEFVRVVDFVRNPYHNDLIGGGSDGFANDQPMTDVSANSPYPARFFSTNIPSPTKSDTSVTAVVVGGASSITTNYFMWSNFQSGIANSIIGDSGYITYYGEDPANPNLGPDGTTSAARLTSTGGTTRVGIELTSNATTYGNIFGGTNNGSVTLLNIQPGKEYYFNLKVKSNIAINVNVRLYADVNGGTVNWTAFTSNYAVTNSAWSDLRLAFTPLTSTGIRVAVGNWVSGGSILVASASISEIATAPYVRTNGWQIGQNPRNIDPAENVSYVYSLDAKASTSYSIVNKTIDFVLGTAKKIINPVLQNSSLSVSYQPKDRDFVGVYDNSMNYVYAAARPTNDFVTLGAGDNYGFRYQQYENSSETVKFTVTKSRFDFDVPGTTGALVVMGRGTSSVAYPERRSGDALDNPAFAITMRAHPSVLVTLSSEAVQAMSSSEGVFVGQRSWQGNIGKRNSGDNQERLFYTLSKVADQNGQGSSTAFVVIGSDNGFRYTPSMSNTSETVKFTIGKFAKEYDGTTSYALIGFGDLVERPRIGAITGTGPGGNNFFGESTKFDVTKSRVDSSAGTTGSVVTAGRNSSIASVAYPERRSGDKLDNAAFDFFKTAFAGSSVTWTVQLNTIDPSPDIEYQASSVTITYGPKDVDRIGMLDRFNLFYTVGRIFDQDFVTIGTDTGFRYQPTEFALENTKFFVIKGLSDTVPMLDLTGIFDGLNSFVTIFKTESSAILDISANSPYPARFMSKNIGVGNHNGTTDIFYIGLSSTVTGIRTQPTESALENTKFTFVKAPGQNGVDDTSVVTVGNWQTLGDRTISTSELVTFNVTKLALQGVDYSWAFGTTTSRTTAARGDLVYAGDPTFGGGRSRLSGSNFERIGFDFFKTAFAGSSVTWSIQVNTIDPNPDVEYQQSSITLTYGPKDLDAVGSLDRFFLTLASRRTFDQDFVTIGVSSTNTGIRYQPTESNLENTYFTITKSRFDFDVPGTTGAVVTMGRGTSNVAFPERRSGDSLDNPAFTITLDAKVNSSSTFSYSVSGVTVLGRDRDRLFVGQQSWQGNAGGFRNAGDGQERLFYTLSKVADQDGLGSSLAYVVVGSDNGFRYTPSMANTSETVKFTFIKAPGQQGAFDTSVATVGNWQTIGDRTISSSELVTFTITQLAKQGAANTWSGYINNSSFTTTAADRGERVYVGDPFRGVYPLRRSGAQAEKVGFDFFKTAFAGSSVTWSIKINTIDSDPDFEWRDSSVTAIYGPKDTDAIGMWDRWWMVFTSSRSGPGFFDFVTVGSDTGFRYQTGENSSETVKFTITKSRFDFDVPGTTGAIVTLLDDLTIFPGRNFFESLTISDNSRFSPYPAKDFFKTTGIGGAGSSNTIVTIGSGVDDRLAYAAEKTYFTASIRLGQVAKWPVGSDVDVAIIGWGDLTERPRTGITYGGFFGDTISGEATTFNITKLAEQGVDNTWSGYINSSSFLTTAATNGERVYVGDPFRGAYPLRRSGAQAENVSIDYAKTAKIGRVQTITNQFIDGNNGYASGSVTSFNTSDTDIVGVFSGIIDVRTFVRNPWIADYDGIPGALDAYITPDERNYKLITKRMYLDDGSMGTDNAIIGTALRGRNSSNLLTYSEQITTSNGAWIVTNGTIDIITDDTTYTNPLGGATGVTKLSPMANNRYIGQEVTSNVVAGMPHTFSIWAKTSGPTSGVGLYADIDGGAVGFTGSAFSFNGSWTRYAISFVPTTTVGVRVFIGNATVWDANEPIWVWGAQLSQTTTSIAYVATTNAPVLDIVPDHYAGDELENVNLLLDLRAKRGAAGTLLLNTIDPNPDVEWQQSSVEVTVTAADLDAVGTLDYFSIYYMLYRQFDEYLTIGSGIDSRLGYANEKASFVFTKLLGQFGDNEAPILDLAGVYDGNIFSAILSKADVQIVGSGQTSQAFPARTKSGATEIVGFDFSKTTGIGGAGSSNTVAILGRATDGRLGSAVEKAYFTVTATLGNARDTSVQTQAIAGSGVDDRLGYANEKTFFTVSKTRFDRDVAGTTGALVVMGRGASSATYPEKRSGDQLDTAAFLYGMTANRGTSGTVTLKLIDPTDGNGFNSSAAVSYQPYDYDVVGSIDFMSATVATGRSPTDFITIGTDTGFRYQQYQNSSETVKFTVGKFAKEFDGTTSYAQIGWGDLIERPRVGTLTVDVNNNLYGETTFFTITKLAEDYDGTTSRVIMGRGLTSVAYPERRSGDNLDNPAFDFAKTAQFLGPATLTEFSEPFSIGETGVTVTAVRNDSTIDPVFVGSLGYYPVADILANSSTTSIWIQQTQQSGYTQGTTYNFSIYMRQPVALSNSITFDIGYTSLAVITTTTSFTVSNSWSRYNFNFVAPRSSLTVRIRTTNTTRRDSLEVFGAQIVAGTSPQTYVKTTTVGSASNLILQSEDFNSATWTKSSNTIVYGNITRGPEELGTVDRARPGDSQEELYYTIGKKADSDGVGSSLAFVTMGAGDNYGFRYQQYENSSETVKFTVGKFAKEYDGTTSYVMMGRGVTTAAYPERQQPTESSLENSFFDITMTAKRGVAGNVTLNTIDSNPDIEFRVSSVTISRGSWQPDEIGMLDAFNLFYQITRTFDTDTVTIGTDNGFRYQQYENSSETVKFLIGKNIGVYGGHPFDAAITGEGSTMLDLTNVFDGLVYNTTMLKTENQIMGRGTTTAAYPERRSGDSLDNLAFDFLLDAKAGRLNETYTVSGTTVRARDRDRLFVGQQSWQGNTGGFRNAGDGQERISFNTSKVADQDGVGSSTAFVVIGAGDNYGFRYQQYENSSETVKFTVTKSRFDFDVPGTTGAIVTIGRESTSQAYPERRSGDSLDNPAFLFGMTANRGTSGTVTLKLIDPANGDGGQSSGTVSYQPYDYDVVGTIDFMFVQMIGTGRQFLDSILVGSDTGFRYQQYENSSETVKFTITKLAKEHDGTTSYALIGWGDLVQRPRTGPTIVGDVVSGEGIAFNITKSRVDSSLGTTGSVITVGRGTSSVAYPEKRSGQTNEIAQFLFNLDAKAGRLSETYTVSGTTVLARDQDRVFVGQQSWQGNTATRNAGDRQERLSFAVTKSRFDFDVPGTTGAIVTVGSDTGFRYQQYENSSETVKFTVTKLAEDYDGTSSRVVIGRGTTSVAYPERRAGDDLDHVVFDFVKTAKRGTSGNVTLNTIDPNPDVEFFVSSVTVSRSRQDPDEVGMLDRFNLFYVVTRAFDQDLVTIGSDTGFRYQQYENSSETVKFTVGKNIGRFGGHPFDASITGEGSTMLDITDLYDGLVYNTTMLKRDSLTIGRGTTTAAYPERRSGDSLDNPAFDFIKTALYRGNAILGEFNNPLSNSTTGVAITAIRNDNTTDPVFVGSQGYYPEADVLANSSNTGVWVQQVRNNGGFTSGTTYNFSIYMRRPADYATSSVAVDIGQTGLTIITNTTSFTVTNTWARYNFNFVAPRTSLAIRIRTSSTTVRDALEVFGAQITAGTSPQTYVKTSGTTSASNLLLWSEDFNDASWAKSSNTIVYANMSKVDILGAGIDWARPGDSQEEMYYRVEKVADADGAGSSLAFVTIGAGDNYGFRYQQYENSSETVKFTLSKEKFDFDVPGTTGAIVTIDSDDANWSFTLDAKQGSGTTTTLSGTTVRARDRDRLFVGQQLWQGNQGKRVSGDALESFVIDLYKPVTETETTILDRPFLYNEKGTIYDDLTIFGDGLEFMNVSFQSPKIDFTEITDLLVINVVFPVRVFDTSGDLDLNGNINTVASYGNLRMTDYADIAYFDDDYVGEKRSFT